MITKYIIYKTTNLINGKIYIGRASGSRIKSSYLGSGKLIKQAIIKYGENNFRRKIIDIAKSKQEQNKQEIFWIDFYNSRNHKIGYNIAEGGKDSDTLLHHPNKKAIGRKISRALTGQKHPEHSKRMSGKKHPFYGKKRPDHSARMLG